MIHDVFQATAVRAFCSELRHPPAVLDSSEIAEYVMAARPDAANRRVLFCAGGAFGGGKMAMVRVLFSFAGGMNTSCRRWCSLALLPRGVTRSAMSARKAWLP